MADPNWRNRTLFHGDNLGFLRAMNSESVDLIATDPPFNKGRDFHATPDSLAAGAKFQDRWSWERDVHQEWTDQITDDHPRLMEAIESARYAHSDGMGAYMCFMAVRLLEMRRVLKPTGSIYLHCDPTASHYLKAVMDAIFGWRNFTNEVLWLYKTGGMSKRWFGRKHDNILFYAKGREYVFNPQREKSYLSHKYGFSNEPLAKLCAIRSGARTPKLATTSAHGNWCDFDGDHGRISVDAASDSVFSSNFGRVWPHRLSRSAAAVMAKERSRTRSAER